MEMELTFTKTEKNTKDNLKKEKKMALAFTITQNINQARNLWKKKNKKIASWISSERKK